MPLERMPRADYSLISYPLEWLTRAVVRFPIPTLVIACAAVGVSIWLTATQLGFRTSRAELLSPNSDYNRRWLDYTKEFGAKEDVVVVVEGESREQIVPALDEVCRELAGRGDLFAAIMSGTDAPKLRSKGLYYLQPDELQKIDGFLDQATPILQGDWSKLNLGGMAGWIGAAMSGGSASQRQQILAAMQTELPRAIGGLTAALSDNSARNRMPDWSDQLSPGNQSLSQIVSGALCTSPSKHLLSDDGRMGFVLLKLREEDKQSFAQNSESIGVLRQITAAVQSLYPGTKIGLTGLPIIEFDEMRSSETSMTFATILSFLGVLAVMIVAFGGFRHSILAMTALAVGMIWACGCVTLTIGHLNILSIAFGSILFGLGIDYGIYYVAHYLQHRKLTDSTGRGAAADGGLRRTGHPHRRGHRRGGLPGRGLDRVSRRGPTRPDGRRRNRALLAGANDRSAGDDPACSTRTAGRRSSLPRSICGSGCGRCSPIPG